jgi:hypothetical protein
MVQLAQAGEFEQLCEMGGGNCEEILETAGAQNVPLEGWLGSTLSKRRPRGRLVVPGRTDGRDVRP